MLLRNFRRQRCRCWRHLLSFSLLEESYTMKDPFASDGDRFLVLGSRCHVCSRLVCAGPVSAPRAAVAVILPPVAGTPHAWSRERGRVSLSQGWCAPQPFRVTVSLGSLMVTRRSGRGWFIEASWALIMDGACSQRRTGGRRSG